jgi:hypothetical protein
MDILIRKHAWERPFVRPRCKQKGNNITDLKDIECEKVESSTVSG